MSSWMPTCLRLELLFSYQGLGDNPIVGPTGSNSGEAEVVIVSSEGVKYGTGIRSAYWATVGLTLGV